MTVENMTNGADELPRKSVTARRVKSVRLMRTAQRPDDFLLEINTGKGVEHFLFPKSSLSDLAKGLERFQIVEQPAAGSA